MAKEDKENASIEITGLYHWILEKRYDFASQPALPDAGIGLYHNLPDGISRPTAQPFLVVQTGNR